MNWDAEMDKPLFVRNGGGFVTMRQALELRRLREGANWYAELRQKLVAAGFKIVQEDISRQHVTTLTVLATSGSVAKRGDKWVNLLKEIVGPYSIDPVEKWAKNTGNPVPPELQYRRGNDPAVYPSIPAQPGHYTVIFTPISDDPPHDDSGEFSVAESVVDALLESVAVDLDGTLAKDSGWKGPEHIGEPVKPMLDLVKKLLDDGEEVVIFTARVHDGEKSTKEHIAQWLKDHDLPALEITNEKRPDMEKFYDDKAVAVEKNKGVDMSESVSRRVVMLVYYPKKGYRHENAIVIIDGQFSPSQIMKMIRVGAEKLSGRRLSWSRDDLRLQTDFEGGDPEKARSVDGIAKIILGQDGSVSVLPA